jgi:NADPH:quinone reductase-like Zn-dependent oxidoreductase
MIFRPVELIGYHIVNMVVNRPDLFQRDLAEVTPLIARGVAVPDEPSGHPLSEAAQALEALANRKTTGKIVLVP